MKLFRAVEDLVWAAMIIRFQTLWSKAPDIG